MPTDDYAEVHHIAEYTRSLEIEIESLKMEIVVLKEKIDSLELLLSLKV